MINALELHTAGGAGEGNEALGHGIRLNAQRPCGSNGGQCIHAVVAAQYPQIHVGIEGTLAHDIKAGMTTLEVDRIDVHIRGQTEGNEPAVNALQRIHGVFIHAIGDDDATIRRGQLRKLPEGVLDVLQILEEVQMIGINIQNHGNGGGEVQEGIAVLAGLHNDGVAMAHPVTCVQ